MPAVPHLRALLNWAEQHDAPEQLQRAAARELVNLLDQPAPDPRRVATFRLARQIERLRTQGMRRADICARLDITPRQHDRARAVLRDFGCAPGGDFPPSPPKE